MGDFWARDSIESGFSGPIVVGNIMVWLRWLVGGEACLPTPTETK